MVESYPKLVDKIVVISQPPPKGFINKIKSKEGEEYDNGLSLFYPASGYPHKNHNLIAELSQSDELCGDIEEIIITLHDDEGQKHNFQKEKVTNVGRLSPRSCMDYYGRVDALFFPSVAESYGLPLVEAMVYGIPIICSDLPYARWLCGDNAVYFNPQDPRSASKAISEVKRRLLSGWVPDWKEPLSKLPVTWGEVGKQFIDLL